MKLEKVEFINIHKGEKGNFLTKEQFDNLQKVFREKITDLEKNFEQAGMFVVKNNVSNLKIIWILLFDKRIVTDIKNNHIGIVLRLSMIENKIEVENQYILNRIGGISGLIVNNMLELKEILELVDKNQKKELLDFWNIEENEVSNYLIYNYYISFLDTKSKIENEANFEVISKKF